MNPLHGIDLSLVLPGMLITGCRLCQRHRVGRFWAAFWLALSVFMGSVNVAALMLILGSGDTEAIPPLVMVSVIVVLAASDCTEWLVDLRYTWRMPAPFLQRNCLLPFLCPRGGNLFGHAEG